MAQTAIWKTIAANDLGGGDLRNRYLILALPRQLVAFSQLVHYLQGMV